MLRRALGWVGDFAIPGLGMFNEAYYIFSVGNIKPIWTAQYPSCWRDHTACSEGFLKALDFSQVAGLFLGMVIVGLIVDRIGRRASSIGTAVCMLIGAILLTIATGPNPRDLFLFVIIVQAFFGAAVGGEFPVAAASAAERAEAEASLRAKRGRTVVLVFSMQAWGNILNLVVLIACIAGLSQQQAPFSAARLGLTWRLQYGIGIAPIALMLFHRLVHLKESAVWKEDQRRSKLQEASSSSFPGSYLLLRRAAMAYGPRLIGTSLGWFAWDFYYYAQKLFQAEFIEVLHPGSNLLQNLEYNLLNSSVAAAGIYLAAFTIDAPWLGRQRMQVLGFFWIFALFLICGLAYPRLTSSAGNLKWFQTMYYLSSFWGQFGPNATTFLLASELFPTQLRGRCHGVSAAVGKLGALAADVILGHVDNRVKFYLSAAAGALGILVTLVFVPDVTTLDLAEADVRWDALSAGAGGSYSGDAVRWRNLSWLERWQGLHKQHKPHEQQSAAEVAATAAAADGISPLAPDRLTEGRVDSFLA